MSWYSFLLLLCMVFTVMVGVIILRREVRNLNMVFAAVSFLIAASTFVSYLISRAEYPDQVYDFLHLISVRMLIFPMSVQFFLTLTRQDRLLRNTWVYVLLYSFPALAILTTDPKGLFSIEYLGSQRGWAFHLLETSMGTAIALFVLLMTLLLVLLGVFHVLRAPKGLFRKRAWFVLIGFVIALLIPVIMDLPLPFLPKALPEVSPITFVVGYALIAYAVVRYDLFAATPEAAAHEVMKSINDAVVLTDNEGRITYVNTATLKLSGYSLTDVMNSHINELFRDPIYSDSQTFIRHLNGDYLRHKSGRLTPVIISQTHLKKGSSRILGNAFIIYEITHLTDVMNKLRESERKYRLVGEYSSDIVTQNDENGLFTYVSPSIHSLGFDPDKLIGTLPVRIIHPSDIVRVRDLIAITRERVDGFVVEYQLVNNEGKVFHVETRGTWVAADGKKFLVCNTRDISLRVEIAQRLEISEARYRELFDRSPDEIFLVNMDYEIILLNQKASANLSVNNSTVLSTSIEGVISEEQFEQLNRKSIEIFNRKLGQEPQQSFFTSVTGGRFYNNTLIPVRSESGGVRSMMIIRRDITDIEHAQAIIRENEEKYRIFLENFQGIAFRMDLSNHIEFLYGDVENITGYSIKELIEGKPTVGRIIHREDRMQMLKAIRMLRRIPNSKTTNECRIIHRNGSIRYLKIYMQNLVNSDGVPSYIQAAMFDKTDFFNVQNQIINSILETEDRERSRFAEDLHDELGPLLSSIRMYVNLIQIKTKNLGSESNELIEFTKQLLDDAVQQTKNISYNIMPEILTEYGLVASIKAYCSRINKANEILIEINTEGIDESVRFDVKIELALYRVLRELIYNTVRHAKASEIFIRFSKKNNNPLVDYSDNGVGFDVDEKIRLGKTLGVRNVIHRIQSVNGQLQFNSAPGKGTRVTIFWQ